ncbi:MAG: hypothetical protein ACRDNJ_04565 [Solirubrobacteraceae bacterium]
MQRPLVRAAVVAATVAALAGTSVPGVARSLRVSSPLGAAASSRMSSPQAAATSSPSAAARALLVTRAQLGHGWTVSSPAPRRVPPIACGRLHVRLTGAATRPKADATPTFARGAGGPFFSQAAYLYAAAAPAATAWRAVARRALMACLAQSLARGGGRGVTFRVTRRRFTRPRGLGAAAVLFSLQANASGAGQTDQAFLDVLLLHRGAGIDELSFTSLLQASPRALERRFGRAAARRLAALPSR